jgi:hypothetical protein
MQTNRLGVVVASCLLILAKAAARTQDAPSAGPQTSAETNSLPAGGDAGALARVHGEEKVLA